MGELPEDEAAALVREGNVVEKRRFEARVPVSEIAPDAVGIGMNQAANQVARHQFLGEQSNPRGGESNALEAWLEGQGRIGADPDGRIDFNSIDRLTDFYVGCGSTGMTVLGVMGEAPKLDGLEALEVATRFIKRAPSLPVIVGVSAPGFAAMRSLAHAAMDAGAAGVGVKEINQREQVPHPQYQQRGGVEHAQAVRQLGIVPIKAMKRNVVHGLATITS